MLSSPPYCALPRSSITMEKSRSNCNSMKGIILAGGTGSRLFPLTKVTNKHLLPVYDRPMIYYPLQTLTEAGIRDIMIVSGKGHAGGFLELLGDGHAFGVKISYAVQEQPGGIAQALGLAADFADGEKVVVILGDNILEDSITKAVQDFSAQEKGAKIFLKEVQNPKSFGVAEIQGEKIASIIEKPAEPKSNYAVIGLYMYDGTVFDVVTTLKPSARGELEVTDLNNYFEQQGTMTFEILQGSWGDGGESFDSLLSASALAQAWRQSGKLGKPIGAKEE
jgi:glucose-1-phosphate thymidylyltransferase